VDAREFDEVPVSDSDIGDLESAVGLYREEFLRGFGVRDASAFDDWIFFTAEQLQTRLGTILFELVRRLTPIDTTRAISYAERLVFQEPLNEDHHRDLIDLYVTEGRFSAAIRQYEKCREMLARELLEEPSSDLTELYESLLGKSDRLAEPTQTGSGYLRRTILALTSLSDAFSSVGGELRRALGRVAYGSFAVAALVVGIALGAWHGMRPPSIPTILVTPFVYSYLGDPGQARPSVASTLTRFVENELISGSVMNIIGARSSRTVEGGLGDLLQLARGTVADYVVAGEILDDGVQYTVTLRLVDRWRGELLMGHDFTASDLDLVILLQAMTDIAAESIFRELGPEMTEYLTSANALLNPYCETATLLMGYHMDRMHSEEERAALYALIKENLQKDPYLREGYFIQADWYWVAAIYGVMPPGPAEELLRTALEFADESEISTDMIVTVGIYSLIYERNLYKAMERFSAAHGREPYHLPAARWYALTLAIDGRLDEANALLASMERYAPADPSLRLYEATFRYLSGDFEAAIGYAQLSVDRNDRWIGLMQQGQALLALGRNEEAVSKLESAVAVHGTMQAPKAYLTVAYSRLGRDRDARHMRASLAYDEPDDPGRSRSAALEGAVSIALGETDQGRPLIERAAEQRDPMLWLLAHDPVLGLGPELNSLILPDRDVAGIGTD
jgi:tetratricopeptide (TPR) repeat protein